MGDTSGKLLVYKNDDSKPWITRSCVGMVSEMKRLIKKKNASDTLILNYVHSFKSCVCAPADLCGCRGRLQQRKGTSSLQNHIMCILSKTPKTLFVSVAFMPKQNYVVAVGAEGWFHLFDLTSAAANKADSSSQHEFTLSEDQKPLFTQHIPANTKVILISDIGKACRCTPTH